DDSSSDDRDENEEAYQQYHQQHFGAHQQSQASGQMHTSSRDSVDSITRELEMLKVPWNKSNLGGVSMNASKKSPSPSQQQQQQQQPYQYSNNFYNIGGEDQDDNIHSYSYTNTNQSHLYNDDSDNDDNIHSHHYHQHHHPQEENQGEEEEGYEDDFLSRLRRSSSPSKVTTDSGTSSSNKTTAVATKDTHSFNDRSPSRLREYEQLIDEMEKSRMR
ncbi:hypothetical protein BGZ92_006783, partial [Podila epicladia]